LFPGRIKGSEVWQVECKFFTAMCAPHYSQCLRKSIEIAERKGTMDIIVNSIGQRIFIDVTMFRAMFLRAPRRGKTSNESLESERQRIISHNLRSLLRFPARVRNQIKTAHGKRARDENDQTTNEINDCHTRRRLSRR